MVSPDLTLLKGGPLKACAKLRRKCPIFTGTQQKLVAALLPLVATVILVIAGSALTGPSMNPAHAFSWNYFLQGHDLREHMAVFWVAPLSGALLAGLFWNYITRTPAKKAPRGPKYTPKKNSAAGKQAKKDE